MDTSTSAMAATPDVTHHFAQVNGADLHYVTAGQSGTPVLLVHGFPETWWAFRNVIPILATRHRVYAVDLRGFGDSDIVDEHHSSAIAAQDLHELIALLAVGPMHVVGQDISGGVVYRLAASHPADVISLTAIEAGLAGFGAERLADVTHGGVWYIGALAAAGVASLLFEKSAHQFLGEYLYPFYNVSDLAVTAADIDEFARTYSRPGGFSGAAALYRGLLTEGEDLRQRAQNGPLQMPVTAIGSRGRGFTENTFRETGAQQVSAIQLEGVGHYVAQENPQLLADHLLTAFARARKPLSE